jgi:TIR domain
LGYSAASKGNEVKQKIKYFVSYAHRNSALTCNFIDRLDDVLAPSKRFEYSRWQDTDLILGEKWEEKINEAIANCDFGLLLISPAFLASNFITKKELPKFVSGKKSSVPVMLQPVDFDRHDLKGLQKRQIFRFAPKGSTHPKAYAECKSYRRDAFVMELFRQIERKLDLSTPNPRSNTESTDPVLDLRLFELATDAYKRRGTPKYFLDSQSLTLPQKAALYDKVVRTKRGRPAKNNPYK